MKHISLAFGTSLFRSIVMHIIFFLKKDQMLWEVVLLVFGTFFSINTYSKLLCVYCRAYTYVFEKNILGKRERERAQDCKIHMNIFFSQIFDVFVWGLT